MNKRLAAPFLLLFLGLAVLVSANSYENNSYQNFSVINGPNESGNTNLNITIQYNATAYQKNSTPSLYNRTYVEPNLTSQPYVNETVNLRNNSFEPNVTVVSYVNESENLNLRNKSFENVVAQPNVNHIIGSVALANITIMEPNLTTGPIEIPVNHGESFPNLSSYVCGGCKLESKCFPFGYRKEGKFCSESENFELQLESEKSCKNSFECGSNVCVSGKCVSDTFIQKIVSWFKKLFGS